MRFGKPALIGAGLGFLAGIAFTVVSLFRYDQSETTLGSVLAAGLLIGVPITVALGTVAGWMVGKLMGGPVD